METKPLSWQKLRHLLDAAGVLDQGWKIGAKRDSDMIAVIWFDGPRAPGKRRIEKLTKTLEANGIAFLQQDPNRIGIPRAV